MTSRPQFFKPDMAEATWRGAKTQTRRFPARQPSGALDPHIAPIIHDDGDALFRTMDGTIETIPLPFTQGDLLWVRENWHAGQDWDNTKPAALWAADPIWYAAEGACTEKTAPARGFVPGRQRPSIHMPRWASRMTLVVTEVRIQRIRDIDRADAIAEGIQPLHDPHCPRGRPGFVNYLDPEAPFFGDGAARLSFSTLWDKLYAQRGLGWDANPWVAAATFERLRMNIAQKEAA